MTECNCAVGETVGFESMATISVTNIQPGMVRLGTSENCTGCFRASIVCQIVAADSLPQ